MMTDVFSFDMSTNIIKNNEVVSSYETDMRLSLPNMLKVISELEKSFGKADFKEDFILFRNVNIDENSACIYINKFDCSFLKLTKGSNRIHIF